MDIEKSHVGRVIGKGGETIRDIQQRSRVRACLTCMHVRSVDGWMTALQRLGSTAHTHRSIHEQTECQIDQNFPDHLPRKLTISGPADNVKLAVDMVKAVIAEVREGERGGLFIGRGCALVLWGWAGCSP